MYSKKSIWKKLILVFAILIVLIILLCSLGDIKAIWNVLTTKTNYLFVGVCILLAIIYCLLFQASLTIIIKKKYKEIKLIDTMYIAGTEFFFNGITPFSSGGQPFQAYGLKQKNMKLSDSTSALLLNFLIYQIAINLFSIVCMVLYFTRLKEQVDNFIWLLVVGFSINLVIMLFLIGIGTIKWVGNLFVKLLVLFSKIKFLNKFLSNKIEPFKQYISETQAAFKEMYKYKGTVILSFMLKILGLAVYYCIPFFIFWAIGVKIDISNMFYVIAMTSFALTISIWVPTPGASGGAELAFTTLFIGLLAGYSDVDNLTMSGMLLWRLVTYYFLMAYGFVMYILFERGNKYEDRVVY